MKAPVFQAGYAKADIIPDTELHLIGNFVLRPRRGKRHRDGLCARALALSDGEKKIVIVAADLLCVSEELHLALVERLTELEEDELLLAATHTHSSYGGFFHSPAIASILGAPRKEIFDFLVERLADVARRALDDQAPAKAQFGSATVPGMVTSRRQADGPVDDRLSLLRLERQGRSPIEVVNASGHPVMVCEREANTVSADYPGHMCRLLEKKGSDPLFLSAALGGVSILFPEFAMDLERHMQLIGGLLLAGYSAAEQRLEPLAVDQDKPVLQVDFFRLAHRDHASHVFSAMGKPGRLADALAYPLLRWLANSMRDALPFANGVPLHLVAVGDFCLLGSANELGPTVVKALREEFSRAGYKGTLVASLANGYAGYLHMPPVYRCFPERGYRFLALYENSLAMFGQDFGQKIVAGVAEKLAKKV